VYYVSCLRSKGVLIFMRNRVTCLWSVGLLCGIISAIARAQETKTQLEPGAFLPGPFQVLMMTGERAGKYHCPVCEYDLRPVVLVFLPDADTDPKQAEFLQRLDTLIGKYPAARLGGCAVFMNDGDYRKLIKQPIEENEKVKDLPLTSAIKHKEETETKIKKLAADANLKFLSLGLASHADVAKYAPDKNQITVLFYLKQRVISTESFAKDKLTDAEMERMLQSIEAKCAELTKSARMR